MSDNTFYDKKVGSNLYASLNDEGTLFLFGKGVFYKRLNKQNIFTAWDGYRDNIKKVVVKTGVEEIPNDAFDSCRNLESVILADTVINIGSYAFARCENLKNIIIKEGLETIGEYAFHSCSKLEGLHVPKSIKSIHAHAFDKCSELQKIYLPASLTLLGHSVFAHCSSLKEVFIPGSLAQIDHHTFYGCSNLKKVTVSKGVYNIESQAFGSCEKLSVVLFQDTQYLRVAFDAFDGCMNLTAEALKGIAPKNGLEFCLFSNLQMGNDVYAKLTTSGTLYILGCGELFAAGSQNAQAAKEFLDKYQSCIKKVAVQETVQLERQAITNLFKNELGESFRRIASVTTKKVAAEVSLTVKVKAYGEGASLDEKEIREYVEQDLAKAGYDCCVRVNNDDAGDEVVKDKSDESDVNATLKEKFIAMLFYDEKPVVTEEELQIILDFAKKIKEHK